MRELARGGREFTPSRRKIILPGEIERVIKAHADQRLVVAGGSFDIWHPSHIAYLEESKAQGDILFVAITSDQSIEKRKGVGKPINNQDFRARVVAAQACVDYVIPLPYGEGANVLKKISPDIWTRGMDSINRPPNQHHQKVVDELGIPVVYVGDALFHSSDIIARIRGSK